MIFDCFFETKLLQYLQNKGKVRGFAFLEANELHPEMERKKNNI